MLHTAVQCFHKSPTYRCICAGIAYPSGSSTELRQLYFSYQAGPLLLPGYTFGYICLKYPERICVSSAVMTTTVNDFCTSQRLFDLENSVFVVGSRYMLQNQMLV